MGGAVALAVALERLRSSSAAFGSMPQVAA
jgi:hypothetical protein